MVPRWFSWFWDMTINVIREIIKWFLRDFKSMNVEEMYIPEICNWPSVHSFLMIIYKGYSAGPLKNVWVCFILKEVHILTNLCLYNVGNCIHAEKVKVAFVTCEKDVSYFLNQNSLMPLVQLTLPGNFETLEAGIFQTCFFNGFPSLFPFVCAHFY